MNGLSPVLSVQSERHKPGYSPNNGKIDGIWGLDRDAAITFGHCRNRECSVGHGVENGNGLTDGVVARRDSYLFTVSIRDHIVEHDWIGSEADID